MASATAESGQALREGAERGCFLRDQAESGCSLREQAESGCSLSADVLESSLRILSAGTHALLSGALDGRKVLLSPAGLYRDWRGLATEARLDAAAVQATSRISFAAHVIYRWAGAGGTVGRLVAALAAMDRHDVLHDVSALLTADHALVRRQGLPASYEPPGTALTDDPWEEHILTVDDRAALAAGLGPARYDALVLHADEDAAFLRTLLSKLEGEHGLKLCVAGRDLVGGLQFSGDGVLRLITERCRRVVALLSPAFLRSPTNAFFVHFATWLSVESRRRIVIPCLLSPCEKPYIIAYCHSLDYFKAQGYWDFWARLADSLRAGSSSTPRPRALECAPSTPPQPLAAPVGATDSRVVADRSPAEASAGDRSKAAASGASVSKAAASGASVSAKSINGERKKKKSSVAKISRLSSSIMTKISGKNKGKVRSGSDTTVTILLPSPPSTELCGARTAAEPLPEG